MTWKINAAVALLVIAKLGLKTGKLFQGATLISKDNEADQR